MAQITVQKCNDSAAMPQTLLKDMQNLADTIRQRAFSFFENRNGNGDGGSDLEDWLRAERDVVWSPPAELVDEEKDFRVRMGVPGFDAKDIRILALPDALVIRADATHTHEGSNGNVRFCEFSDKKLFRRLGLPASVDVDKVSASLDKGVLQVIAPKTSPKQIAATA